MARRHLQFTCTYTTIGASLTLSIGTHPVTTLYLAEPMIVDELPVRKTFSVPVLSATKRGTTAGDDTWTTMCPITEHSRHGKHRILCGSQSKCAVYVANSCNIRAFR